MTLTTFIAVNAALGAAVVYGLLRLLLHGIKAESQARLREEGLAARARELAA